jgi:hypothetical protein
MFQLTREEFDVLYRKMRCQSPGEGRRTAKNCHKLCHNPSGLLSS